MPPKRKIATRAGKIQQPPADLNWFDLKNYKQVPSLRAGGWYEQLIVRSYLDHHFTSPVEARPPENSLLLEIWQRIKKQGLVSLTPQEASALPDGRRLYGIKTGKSYQKGVRPLNVATFDRIQWGFDSAKWAKDKEAERIQNRWSQPLSPITDFVSGKLNKYDFLLVDYRLPTPALAQQFVSYVRARKKDLNVLTRMPYPEQNPETWFRNRAEDWNNFKILPYLDLLIWQKQEGKNLSNQSTADLLFPEGERDGNSVKRTISSMARKATSIETMQILSDSL